MATPEKTYRMMRFSDKTVDKTIKTWLAIVDSIEDENNKRAVKEFTEAMQDSLFSSPASPSVNYPAAHNCMPLGFVEHTLRVLKNFKALVNQHRDEIPHPVHDDDIIIAALFHDMGKIGDLENPYYFDQDSTWHRERGMFYKINPDIEYLKVPNRSLFMLQHFGAKLPMHVYKAILLHDGPADEANRAYCMREGLFAMLLQHADQLAAVFEKQRYEKWLANEQ